MIEECLSAAYPRSVHITDIYSFVEANADFDREDHIPPNLHGKPVNEPRWKRNVRNVLKSESDQGQILRIRRGEYMLPDSTEGGGLSNFPGGTLPTFEMRPQKTFFGLDKAEGCCFTLPKVMNKEMIGFFVLRVGALQREIGLVIDGDRFPAIVRLVRIDRTRPRKLKPGDLPAREVIQFSWKTHRATLRAIRSKFRASFDVVSKGEKNLAETALFVHLGDSEFSLSHGQDLTVEPPDKEIRCNIPSSFVSRHMKLANDRGSGEAKLYVGPVRMKDEFDRFFMGWHPLNTYEFDHVDLLLYLQDVEGEFSRHSKYKGVSRRLYNDLMGKVDRIPDLRVNLSSHTDRSRYYIRGKSEAWGLMRSLAVPLMSELAVERTKEHEGGYADYRLKLVRSEEERPKAAMSGRRQGSKPGRRRKRRVSKPRAVAAEELRAVPQDLKDLIWKRCHGMCQANWRIDPSLDKNTGDICGSNEDLEFDHIVPFSRGGKTTYRNLQLLCRRHNRMKSDREV
jgi:5-methylcytosine-specific restriction endonuclease McrA